MTEGWKCSVCGRGVAPTVKYCNHDDGLGAINQPNTPWPVIPAPYYPYSNPWWIGPVWTTSGTDVIITNIQGPALA